MRSDGKSNLIIGGYKEFGNVAAAIHTLYHIDSNHRAGHPVDIPHYTFNMKICTHVQPDDRMRDSTRLDHIDSMHQPTLISDKLISAYFGMTWKPDIEGVI